MNAAHCGGHGPGSTAADHFQDHAPHARDDFFLGTQLQHSDTTHRRRRTQRGAVNCGLRLALSSVSALRCLHRPAVLLKFSTLSRCRAVRLAGNFASSTNSLHRCSESLLGTPFLPPSTQSAPRLPSTTSPHPHHVLPRRPRPSNADSTAIALRASIAQQHNYLLLVRRPPRCQFHHISPGFGCDSRRTSILFWHCPQLPDERWNLC
jgi:hypothetical protein